MKERYRLSLGFDDFKEIWNNIFQEDMEVNEIIVYLKAKGFPLFLLSNTNELHFTHIIERYPIVHLMDEWILSFEVGAKKPKRRIYDAIFEKMRRKKGRGLLYRRHGGVCDVRSGHGHQRPGLQTGRRPVEDAGGQQALIPYPHIPPEIFRIGPFAVRWYGMMYVLGFASSYFLVVYQARRSPKGVTKAQIDDIYFYLVLGLLIGARLGYVLFYNLPFYIEHPLEIFVLWHGGMSFHGGAAGTFIMGYWAMRRRGLSFLTMADLIIPTAPIGIFFGRIGNFINGELYGRPTDVPWAMAFPEGGNVGRHPSQLYEALLEGRCPFRHPVAVPDKEEKRRGRFRGLFDILPAVPHFLRDVQGAGRSGGIYPRSFYHGPASQRGHAGHRTRAEIRFPPALRNAGRSRVAREEIRDLPLSRLPFFTHIII